VLISYSAGAYIKRMSSDAFRAQNRGGRGIKGMSTRSEDEVTDLLFARTLDHILFFTNKGRVYSSRVYELPEGSRTARGMHIANVLNLQPDEIVTTMLVVPEFEMPDYITLLTRQGRIKRMELNVFANIRSIGLIAMSLDDGDSLDWARLTTGSEDFIVVTRRGRALRFSEEDVRAMGRTAAGVMAIRLHSADDEVVGFDVVKPHAELLVVHVHGYGKRTPLAEYTTHGRYTQGNWATDHSRLEEVGPIVAARVVEPNDQITVMTANGIVLRTKVDGIRTAGRMTRGVRVVNLGEGDTVAAVAVMTHADLNRGVDDGGETGVDLAINGDNTTAGNGGDNDDSSEDYAAGAPEFEETAVAETES
jgi:DNA gyrase subunit A